MVSTLSPDAIVLGLRPSEFYRLVFQPLPKHLPTWLAHLRVLLFQAFALFLTQFLVYLV